jgi:uncharacterized membrane protein
MSDYLEMLGMAAALGSCLVAGIFFAFSAFVMRALGQLPNQEGIAAMQKINVTVLNPWFFTAFFGTAVLCLVIACFGSEAAGLNYSYLLGGQRPVPGGLFPSDRGL